MPSPRLVRSALCRLPIALLLCFALLGTGCRRDSPAQLAVVQAFAEVLGKRVAQRLALACALAVPEHQDPLSCDNLVVPLLHYAPGFPGSKVTRRGATRGGFWGRPFVLPVRYEGKDGSGQLDVTMRLDKAAGGWRIYSFLPVP